MHYSLKRATSWNIAGYIYLIFASLIATPVLVHALGISTFATYSLIIATLSLVSAINLGLPQAVTRALSQDYKFSPLRQTIWATSSKLFILTGVIGGIVAVALSTYLHVSTSVLLLVFAITLMNNLISHYTTLPHAEGHFGYFNAKTFIVGTGNTLLAAFIAYSGFGILTILAFQLLTYFLTLAFLVYFSLKFFPRPWEGRSSKAIAKSLISFGLKNQAGTVVGQIEGQYSKYLLSSLSAVKISAFVVAQGLVYKLVGGISQVAMALYPTSARSSHNPALRPLYYRLQLAIFILGLAGVGLYHTMGLPFLLWWLKSPELVSVIDSIMRIFVWYFAVLVLTPLAASILDGHGRPELTSIFASATTVIEVSVALALFPRFGLFAPVYAALISSLVTTFPLLIVTDRVLRKAQDIGK